MNSDLDAYLDHVDKWKFKLYEKLRGMTPEEEAAFWEQSREKARALGLPLVEPDGSVNRTSEIAGRRLRRLNAAKQKRLDMLMAKNNDGRLTSRERDEMEMLVREAAEVALGNARTLASQREKLKTD